MEIVIVIAGKIFNIIGFVELEAQYDIMHETMERYRIIKYKENKRDASQEG